MEQLEELKIDKDDVQESLPWKAHNDAINCVTFIPELNLIATCAFDQHVYIWDCEPEEPVQVGLERLTSSEGAAASTEEQKDEDKP